jgi:hypothetical protein
MATKKVFKTIFEVRDEKAKLEGMRPSIFYLLRTTAFSDAQIALELNTDEETVKMVRKEFLASKKQA